MRYSLFFEYLPALGFAKLCLPDSYKLEEPTLGDQNLVIAFTFEIITP